MVFDELRFVIGRNSKFLDKDQTTADGGWMANMRVPCLGGFEIETTLTAIVGLSYKKAWKYRSEIRRKMNCDSIIVFNEVAN